MAAACVHSLLALKVIALNHSATIGLRTSLMLMCDMCATAAAAAAAAAIATVLVLKRYQCMCKGSREQQSTAAT
jgi:hypothetical protein